MKNCFTIAFILCCCFFTVERAYSQEFSFGYQGLLQTGGTTANGQFDFVVRLYEGQAPGGLLRGTNTLLNQTVTNGLYSLTLNFGSAFINLPNLHIEVAVRPTGAQEYTVLTPRTKVLAAPLAIRSIHSDSANTAFDANSLDGIGPTGFVLNQTTTQTANFAVSGTGSANILNAFTQFNIGGQKVLSAPSSQNTFVGIGAGQGNGSGFSNTAVGSNAGQNNQTGDENSFFGMNAGSATTGNQNTFIGRGAGITNVGGSSNTTLGANANVETAALTNATAIGAGAIVTFSDTIQLGRHTLDSVRIGRLGSGGSTAVCVNSVNGFATCSSSIRYKSNIADFELGMNLIRDLRPVTFTWNSDNKEDLGLVAEEVAAIEPLLVTRNEKGDVEGVKYDRIGVVLLNAVKDLQRQLEIQQTRIDKQAETTEQLREQVRKQQRELESLRLLNSPVEIPEEMCRPDSEER